MREKISVLCTCFNEERNMVRFMESIINQSVKPDEMIVIDGGSTDKTVEMLNKYAKKHRWVKVYVAKGYNIAQGRNLAVKKSSGEIIFTVDFSTVLEKDWIKKLLRGFEEGNDVVFGEYYSEPKNLIEDFLSTRLPSWEKVNLEKFIPSNRHVAIKREVWEKVGGWPENIRRADDNLFHKRAHELGFKYGFVKNAKVLWLYDRDFKGMLKLAFLDSKSEGFCELWKDRKVYFLEIVSFFVGLLILVAGIFINKLLLLLLLLCFLGVSALLLIFFLKKLKGVKMAFVSTGLFILLYFAHTLGVLAGIIQKTFVKKE